MDRMSRHEMYMEMARLVARRSTCHGSHDTGPVGAVLTSPEGRIYSFGYNGSPPDKPHCIEVGCKVVNGHCVAANHAEANIILNCVRNGIKVVPGAILYSTMAPCWSCAKLMLSIGVSEIYYDVAYDQEAVKYLEESGVIMNKVQQGVK